jgi:hypothetical protein
LVEGSLLRLFAFFQSHAPNNGTKVAMLKKKPSFRLDFSGSVCVLGFFPSVSFSHFKSLKTGAGTSFFTAGRFSTLKFGAALKMILFIAPAIQSADKPS